MSQQGVELPRQVVFVVAESSPKTVTSVQVEDYAINLELPLLDHPLQIGFLSHEYLNLLLFLAGLPPQAKQDRHGGSKVLLVVIFDCGHDDGIDLLERLHDLENMKNRLAQLGLEGRIEQHLDL